MTKDEPRQPSLSLQSPFIMLSLSRASASRYICLIHVPVSKGQHTGNRRIFPPFFPSLQNERAQERLKFLLSDGRIFQIPRSLPSPPSGMLDRKLEVRELEETRGIKIFQRYSHRWQFRPEIRAIILELCNLTHVGTICFYSREKAEGVTSLSDFKSRWNEKRGEFRK